MHVYVACIGYAVLGMLHACRRLGAVSMQHTLALILHLCRFACIGYAFLPILHAPGCVQFGMQRTLACLCLLAFCICFVLHALLMHLWAYFMHARGMQNRDYVCLHVACNCMCFGAFWEKTTHWEMRAVLFCRAFCVHFGMPFCFDFIACIGASDFCPKLHPWNLPGYESIANLGRLCNNQQPAEKRIAASGGRDGDRLRVLA